MIKVKRIDTIESLITESNIINIGGFANSIMNNDNGDDANENLESMNKLLDMLFILGEDQLINKLKDPIIYNIFANVKMQNIILEYLKYIRSRISEFNQEILNEMAKPIVNEPNIRKIYEKIMQFAYRIKVIDVIYAHVILKNQSNSNIKNSITLLTNKINSEIFNSYQESLKTPAENTKLAYSNLLKSQSQSEKETYAIEIFKNLQTANELIEDMPDTVSNNMENVTNDYISNIETILGKPKTDELRKSIEINKETASMIRRIFQFQYTIWTTERDVLTEASKLKASINSMQKTTSQEARDYLGRLVDDIQKLHLENIKNKTFNVELYKGIHYTFNIKLPLYERVVLPVTGEQIADQSWIMKFRKWTANTLGILAGDAQYGGKEYEAFKKTGKWASTIYANVLNYTSKKIGGVINGREGEIKGDAISRLFIPDATLIQKPKEKEISEDAVSPGVSMQTPDSISGMGKIEPPTNSTIGSGDKFSSSKNKHRKSIYTFNDFMKRK